MATATDNRQAMMGDICQARSDVQNLCDWLANEIDDMDCEQCEAAPGPALGSIQHLRASLVEAMAQFLDVDPRDVRDSMHAIRNG